MTEVERLIVDPMQVVDRDQGRPDLAQAAMGSLEDPLGSRPGLCLDRS
jgi:hypothetical protein